MTAQREERQFELEAVERPIEFLTENGFSILRCWEVDHLPAPTNGAYSFLVRDERNAQRQITVTIANALAADLSLRTHQKINRASSFWISCAERCLAEHLWERNDFPREGELVIEYLGPEEIMLAIDWSAQPARRRGPGPF